MLSICGSRNNEDKEACINVFGACMACLYPLAGFIGFSGCMVVLAEFSNHEKGLAFYVSLAASCYIILQLILFCCVMCVLCKEEGGSNGEDNGQEMTQYENNTGRGSSGESDEQETIQHENDPTSGGAGVGAPPNWYLLHRRTHSQKTPVHQDFPHQLNFNLGTIKLIFVLKIYRKNRK
uniref:Uncharacterized protein LOC111101351 n=1 Tax=Crassostrea virginica TaxID=6565 RepID=A0A8B8AHN5_CRAVI|nr:uncharacterized protein LOC111101351 [Crassostrea virginica]